MSSAILPSVPKPSDRVLFRDFGPVLDEILAALKPEPNLTVSEWADEYRILPDTSAEPGPWRTERAPYTKDIMDALSPSHPAEFVVLMKGSQTAGTEVGLNWIGYTIHHAPGLMMLVNPSLDMVKRNTSTRIDPLIAANGPPPIRCKCSRKKPHQSGTDPRSNYR